MSVILLYDIWKWEGVIASSGPGKAVNWEKGIDLDCGGSGVEGFWRWCLALVGPERKGGGRREEPGMGVYTRGMHCDALVCGLSCPVRGWLSPENSKQTKVPSIDHQTRG